MSRPSDPRGFTLIELLVSLVLLALVMTLVYTAFGQISAPALRQRAALTQRQDLRLLVHMVADDLRSAQWLPGYAGKSTDVTRYRTGIIAEPRFLETKQYSEVDFHAARPARFFRTVSPASDPDLHEVGYFVQPNKDHTGMELMRREDFYLDDDITRGGVTVMLADHIKTFTVQFLAPEADLTADPPPWQDTWDSNQRPKGSEMPLAIQLTIARTDGAGHTLSETLEFNLPASLKL